MVRAQRGWKPAWRCQKTPPFAAFSSLIGVGTACARSLISCPGICVAGTARMVPLFALCAAEFHIDDGYRVTSCCPGGILTPEEEKDVAFSSFPVSHSQLLLQGWRRAFGQGPSTAVPSQGGPPCVPPSVPARGNPRPQSLMPLPAGLTQL